MAPRILRARLLAPDRGTPREIVTPEGTPLVFRVARAGDRLGAFLIDTVIQILAIVAVGLLALAGTGFAFAEHGVFWAVILLAIFVIQNLYFIVFEAGARGQTPGKRMIGIRVMDAHGGPLTTDAVVVRNLMRNLEVYLPVAALLQPGLLSSDTPGWIYLLSILWMIALAGLPMFNKWRLRPGDLVAGTLVVVAPKAILLEDVGARAVEKKTRDPRRFVFTDAQLDIYGIYELQVLEEILRGQGGMDHRRTLEAVTDRITKKLGWDGDVAPRDTRVFLEEFYAALRARLEGRMLFGRRKEDKHDD